MIFFHVKLFQIFSSLLRFYHDRLLNLFVGFLDVNFDTSESESVKPYSSDNLLDFTIFAAPVRDT